MSINKYPRKKVKAGNDQEQAQSEKRFRLQKPGREKQTNNKVLIS